MFPSPAAQSFLINGRMHRVFTRQGTLVPATPGWEICGPWETRAKVPACRKPCALTFLATEIWSKPQTPSVLDVRHEHGRVCQQNQTRTSGQTPLARRKTCFTLVERQTTHCMKFHRNSGSGFEKPSAPDVGVCRRAAKFLLEMISALSVVSIAACLAGDWPGFRGPNGDGTCNARIRTDWASNPPKVLWRKGASNNLQDGFSSIAVSGDRLFTMVRRSINGSYQEVCVALDTETGAELWSRPLGPAKYDGGGNEGAPGNSGGDGPRSTPTVNGNRVYVFTAWLALACLDAADGHVVWSVDLTAAPYNASVITWQNAASPIVRDGLVIVNGNVPSKRLMAFNAENGTLVWSGHDDKMTHSTPVNAELLGVPQVIFYAQSGLVAVHPSTGAVLWRHACSYNGVSVASSPVVAGDLVYCSAGYGTGARVIRVSKSGSTFSTTQIARTSGMFESQWATPVCYEGCLYGIFGTKEYATAPLKCLKVDTLEEQWSQDGFGMGGALLVRDKLLVLTDAGALVLIQPTPAAYSEIVRFAALSGKCWNVPAVTDGRIYARSTREIVALDVSVPPPPQVRLEVVRSATDGKVRIRFRNADGTAIEPGRLPGIQVLAGSDVAAPRAMWAELVSDLQVQDGTVFLDELTEAWPQRFYRIVENP
jgi:outer membrane protein assembly factor BamB